MLTREQILGADDLARERVEVPEWGGDYVYVRMLTGRERELYEQWLMEHRSGDDFRLPPNYRAQLVVMTVCDSAGQTLLTLADVAALGDKSWMPINQLYEVAMRLNRLGGHEVEALAGESSASLNGASGTV